jgi:PIN domain nuclease of toxin-antitoxin system
MPKILDASALMSYLEKEPGYEKIADLLVASVERDESLLITTVNYGQVYSIVMRECGQEKVDEIERTLRSLPIDIIDVDINLAKEAARFKATKPISYSDSFAVALTKLRKGELVTGNQHLKGIEKDIKIYRIN